MSALPFPSESFDVVTANMVVEHLEQPIGGFREAARVLRPGGLFLFHTPNVAGFPTSLAKRIPEGAKATLARWLDGRYATDVFPTFYRCNSVAEVERHCEAAGLQPRQLILLSSTAVFAVIPPFALMELLWIRFVQAESRRGLRSNLIAVLQKDGVNPLIAT
jgi:SAM-dependent methyltransferase